LLGQQVGHVSGLEITVHFAVPAMTV